MDACISLYLDVLQNAEPVAEPRLRSLAGERKAAVSRLLKANDPGYPFMVKAFGKETTDAVFDVVF
jgi:hypothetical protein